MRPPRALLLTLRGSETPGRRHAPGFRPSAVPAGSWPALPTPFGPVTMTLNGSLDPLPNRLFARVRSCAVGLLTMTALQNSGSRGEPGRGLLAGGTRSAWPAVRDHVTRIWYADCHSIEWYAKPRAFFPAINERVRDCRKPRDQRV